MFFNFMTFNIGNDDGYNGAVPVLSHMRRIIEKCGYATRVTVAEFAPNDVNIVFEDFKNKDVRDVFIGHLKSNNLMVGVVLTELMLKQNFVYTENDFSQGNRLASINSEILNHFQQRADGLKTVLSHCDFTWSFLSRTAEDFVGATPCSEFFMLGNTAPAEIADLEMARDIDIIFCGRNTPYRQMVIDTFASAGLQALAFGDHFQSGKLPRIIYESYLDRAKIGLNLTFSGPPGSGPTDNTDKIDTRFASCSRITEMLDHNVCVVSETIPLDNPYAPYMCSDAPEKLAAHCKALLDSGEWKAKGTAAARAYRRELDALIVTKPAIERTLAALARKTRPHQNE